MNNSAHEVDAEIDEWKLSEEFNDLPHGDALVNDFDRVNKPSIFDHFPQLENDDAS